MDSFETLAIHAGSAPDPVTGAVASRKPVRVGPLRANFPGKEHLDIEVMVLPLSEDGAHVSALLGAFETWRAGTHASAG